MPPKVSRAARLALIGLNRRLRELLPEAAHAHVTGEIDRMSRTQLDTMRSNAWGSMETILSGTRWGTAASAAFHLRTAHLDNNVEKLTMYVDWVCTNPQLMFSFAEGRLKLLDRITRIVQIDLKRSQDPRYAP